MTLSQLLQQHKERVNADGRLNDFGRREALSRAMVPALREATAAYRAKAKALRTLERQLEAARAAAVAKAAPVSDPLLAEIARASREDTQLREYLSILAAAGPQSADDATLLRAFAQAPHPRLFALSEADWKAARSQVKALADDEPEVARLVGAVADAELEARALGRQLKALEPELDRTLLVREGVLGRAPTDLPAEIAQDWAERDPMSYALALADGDRSFLWDDPRAAATA